MMIEVKKSSSLICLDGLPARAVVHVIQVKVEKGVRWMPRHTEAKKDVPSCEKLWGAAKKR